MIGMGWEAVASTTVGQFRPADSGGVEELRQDRNVLVQVLDVEDCANIREAGVRLRRRAACDLHVK